MLDYNGRPIATSADFPPIPTRDYDWSAYFPNEFDGAPDAGPQLIGRGETEAEAIADLIEQASDE